jgi:hypothetical protein
MAKSRHPYKAVAKSAKPGKTRTVRRKNTRRATPAGPGKAATTTY